MRQLKNAESLDSESDTEIVGGKKSCSLKTTYNIGEMSTEELYAMSTEVRSTHLVVHIGCKNSVLPSLTESSYDSSQVWSYSKTVKDT
jgi:hypothetical protein